MDDYIKSHEHEFTVIPQKRGYLYNDILNAMSITKDFIRDNKLIIYGGQAMDYALRLKGDKIYDDEQIPDFDFYSPNNIKHAYDLAELLFKRGFHQAETIRGYHPTTMRVRIDITTYVADISFMPQELFDKTPTLEFEGIRIVHPDFQKIDIHISLGTPFHMAPVSLDVSIDNRWAKDIKRFNLLNKHYPTQAEGSDSLVKLKAKLLSGDCVLYGFSALEFYRQLAKQFKGKEKKMKAEFTFQSPKEFPLSLIVSNPKEVISKLPSDVKITHYTKILNIDADYFLLEFPDGDVVRLYSSYLRKNSIVIYDGIKVISHQILMSTLLMYHFFYGISNSYYLEMLEILNEFQKIAVNDPSFIPTLVLPVEHTIGVISGEEQEAIVISQLQSTDFGDTPFFDITALPESYFPWKGMSRPLIKYTNEIYQMDGKIKKP
ncbi:MAG: hypothetical protein WCT07_04520 [Candidatus Paceibacterota bacterium]